MTDGGSPHTAYEGLHGARVVVAGSRGFLGRTLTPDLIRLLPPSARVTELHRRAAAPALPTPHRSIVADLADVSAYHDALLDADLVIWVATLRRHYTSWERQVAESLEPLRRAVHILRGSARLTRFIFTSSISAVDHQPGDARPISDASVPAPHSPYGRAKLAAEQLLLGSGLPVTVLRLPFLYGPSYAPGTFVSALRRNATSPAWGAVRWSGRLSLLYTGDVADLCLRVADPANRAAADASPYVISDGAVYAYDALVDRAAALLGAQRPSWRWPRLAHELVKVCPMSAELRYWRHVGFDPHFFVADAGRSIAAFAPPFTAIDEGLARSLGLR